MQKPSKVLLVCVYDTIVLEITNEIIRSKFEKFGNITKLLVFEKGEVTKFFIEYEEINFAVKVQAYTYLGQASFGWYKIMLNYL